MMNKVLRIGTRDSQLAVWQATTVQSLLEEFNIPSSLVYIKNKGDLDLETPLYEMGVQGIFTKTLDIALLGNQIDIAVHSMKDVPTQLPQNIVQAAVLERGPVEDLLVYKNDLSFLDDKHYRGNIATGSLRRKAQWLHRYPNFKVHSLRGNVNTRLRKLQKNDWDGAIFASAGLSRIHIRPEKSVELDWMLPAPAQGAILIVCRGDDDFTKDACEQINHKETALCAKIERDFLRTLEGGCSAPISALAVIDNDDLHFKGNLSSEDGKQFLNVEKHTVIQEAANIGMQTAKEILQKGGDAIMKNIRDAVKT